MPSTGRSCAISSRRRWSIARRSAIAIGTEGAGPVLAQMVRAKIDRLLSPSLGRACCAGERFREAAERLLPKGSARRRFWNDFFTGAPARAMEVGACREARAGGTELLLAQRSRATGHVALVGAGPGAEDLLTLRAHRLLMEADVDRP